MYVCRHFFGLMEVRLGHLWGGSDGSDGSEEDEEEGGSCGSRRGDGSMIVSCARYAYVEYYFGWWCFGGIMRVKRCKRCKRGKRRSLVWLAPRRGSLSCFFLSVNLLIWIIGR